MLANRLAKMSCLKSRKQEHQFALSVRPGLCKNRLQLGSRCLAGNSDLLRRLLGRNARRDQRSKPCFRWGETERLREAVKCRGRARVQISQDQDCPSIEKWATRSAVDRHDANDDGTPRIASHDNGCGG